MSKRAYLCGPESDKGSSNSNDWAIVKPRKRRSRWSTLETDKTYVPGMPTQLPPNLTPQQEKMYILQLQIEDISRRLKSGDLGIPQNPDDRSPSPEPIYSGDGKRLNTREYRVRKQLEEDRHSYIQMMMELNPDYKPPTDYKPLANKITDKIFIPQEDHPHINFVGLLIGPRGNTLKALERETGAKIIIRGKGSVKDGKLGRRDGLPMPGEDEPLHAFISAANVEACQKAVKKITEIIRQGIEVPEAQNDLRKAQLRELALLNGTLREHEGLAKLRALAEAQNIATNKIQCTLCGGFGHLASDCKLRDPSVTLESLGINPMERAKMDSEYSALMAELGVGLGGGSNSTAAANMVVNQGGKVQLGPIGKAQPAKQPPPPGVPPPEEEEEETATSSAPLTLSTTTASVKQGDAFTVPLPPPPVPPVPWSMGYVPPASAYPPAVPPVGPPGAFPGAPPFPGSAPWPAAAPSPGGWFAPPAAAWPPTVQHGPPGPPYGGTNDYWGTTAAPNGYLHPPPPPPPGL
nr:unnamed protein product [Spirometra erinaceieuropaei]